MQDNINPKQSLKIQYEIDSLREQLDVLGKSKDDRPNFMKALYPNKIDAIRSKIYDAINNLKLKNMLINGSINVTIIK
jgi:hypothetical protein